MQNSLLMTRTCALQRRCYSYTVSHSMPMMYTNISCRTPQASMLHVNDLVTLDDIKLFLVQIHALRGWCSRNASECRPA